MPADGLGEQRFLPIYADAIAAEVEVEVEVEEIMGAVGADLLLQYEVAVEIGALAGNLPATGISVSGAW